MIPQKNIQSTIFNENDNDKYNNHLRNVIIPQLKLVDGLYDIEKLNKITDFDLNIDTKFNSITFFNSLLSDNKTKFTNFLDLGIVFNNLAVSNNIPYIELYDKFSGEYIYKLHADAAKVPIIDKEILDNWRMTKWINNTLKLKVKVLDDKIVNGEPITIWANVLLYSNSNLEITIQLDDLLDCDTFSKLLFNQIEKNIISVLNKSLQSYIRYY